MKLVSSVLRDNMPIPDEYAFCVPDSQQHVRLGPNKNPPLAWEGIPEGTRSFVLICHDPDVPTKPDDVNQEGRIVPPDLLRTDFYHWVVVDLPASLSRIEEGEFSDRVSPGGKSGPDGPQNSRLGVNNYTDWFANDKEMAGDYYGYDGPCPPWNDSLIHHYTFTLYALDLERCPLDGRFGGPDVLRAIEGHILAQAELTGTYSLNPDVKT